MVGAALVALIYYIAQPWGNLLVSITDVLFVIVSGFCALLAFRVILRWRLGGAFGAIHLGLFLFVALQFLGETSWAIYELLLKTPIPYPSFADVFYLSGYVAGIASLVYFLRKFWRTLTKRSIFSAAVAAILILGLTAIFLVTPLATSTVSILEKAIDVAYPTLDAVLLLLVIFMFAAFRNAKIEPSWQWVSLGVFLTALADIIFSYGTLQKWYYSGHSFELLWLWGYMSLSLAFYHQRKAPADLD